MTYWHHKICIDNKLRNIQMKWQSKIAYLPKFPNMIMLTKHTKFEDNIFVRSSVVTKKCYFSFIKEYKEMILRSSCYVTDDVITMEIFFLA